MSYCSKCGRKLEQDEVCSCSDVKVNYEYDDREDSQTMEIVSKFMKHVLHLWVSIIGKPAATIKKVAVRSEPGAGIFFIAVQGIVLGFGVIALIKSLVKLTGDFNYEYGSIFTQVIDNSIPYAQLFFTTFFLVCAQSFLFALVILLVCKLFYRRRIAYSTIIGIIGVATINMTTMLLAAIILSFLYVPLAMLILLAAGLVNIFLLYIGLREALKLSENKLVYAIPLCEVINIIVVYLAMYIIGKILS